MSRSNNEWKPTSFLCPPTDRDLVRCQVSADGCDTTDAEVCALDVTLPVRIGGIDVKSTHEVSHSYSSRPVPRSTPIVSPMLNVERTEYKVSVGEQRNTDRKQRRKHAADLSIIHAARASDVHDEQSRIEQTGNKVASRRGAV